MPALPLRPSAEYLRKHAKRFARERSVQLAAAQREIAQSYGFPNWAALLREAARRSGESGVRRSPLVAAIRAGDVAQVRRLLAEGVNPRTGDGREPPLHLAARHGPLEVVEALIAGGALVWQPDRAGRIALDAARRGRTRERAAIVALLDRSTIADPTFRAAVAAIHGGDVAALRELLAAKPQLLHERNVGPEAYRLATRSDYFRDPKLFWFIANNPTLVDQMAPNSPDIARTMIERGVEPDDLDYALNLVMTSSAAREQGQQTPLMRELLAAGAHATRDTVLWTAAHRELDALRELRQYGYPPSALIAAALGEIGQLATLLAAASADDVQAAFGLAVINRQPAAAQVALDAAANVDAFLPVHAHSTALHQAAADDRADLIEFLLARGARTDIRDTLWSGTPLDWAIHGQNEAARIALERVT